MLAKLSNLFWEELKQTGEKRKEMNENPNKATQNKIISV